MFSRRSILALPFFALALSACDQLGIETPVQANARIEAEGKAIGGACRHAGRALEDCYLLNKRASKAAVYAGWRDMDAYMRENQIEVIEPAFENDKAPPKKGEQPAGESPLEGAAADAPKLPGEAKKPAAEKPVDKTEKTDKGAPAKPATAKHGALGAGAKTA